jgi:GNAT superfamily N-acetyltransferase
MGQSGARLVIEPLRREHDRAAFSCGVEALDRYLKQQALQDRKRGVATPFVAVEEGSKAIEGFYTLSMMSVDLGELPEAEAKRLPKHRRIPAALLGRLAVSAEARGRGLGRFLLMDALARSLENEIAWAAAIVDAKDEAARSFYERYGFVRFPETPRRLFIMRRIVEQALK